MTQPEHTPTMHTELRAIDEALATGTITSEDALERELQELTLALQAEGRKPSREFGADLRTRVQAGFPRERRLRRPHLPSLHLPSLRLPLLWKLRRPPLPVMGGVASALVAIAIAVSLSDGGDPSPPSDGDAASERGVIGPEGERPSAPGGAGERQSGKAADTAASAPEPAQRMQAPDIAPEPPTGRTGFAPGERERRIERSASLTLAAPGDRLDRVAEGIVRLTDRHEGFVLRSALSTGDEGTTGGDFELRIPAPRLQRAITELSKLADVRARTQSGQDVTPEFVSAQERLEGARAERRSLLRRLERAPNDAAAEAIRRRLDLNAGEVRGLRGRVRDLRTRTNYANVTVTLQARDGDGGSTSPDPGDGLGGAVRDALESLSDSVEIAIRVLGVILPLGLLTGAAVLGTRAVRRRRREAALG